MGMFDPSDDKYWAMGSQLNWWDSTLGYRPAWLTDPTQARQTLHVGASPKKLPQPVMAVRLGAFSDIRMSVQKVRFLHRHHSHGR